MHALWDQLLGPDFELGDVRRRIVEMTGNGELMAKGKLAVAGEKGLDPLIAQEGGVVEEKL